MSLAIYAYKAGVDQKFAGYNIAVNQVRELEEDVKRNYAIPYEQVKTGEGVLE
ncbi:MAG: hypothetical protein IBX64_02705 [Actinobacteria bacterium]|nr:hypothetical protein [Actinomycetota bacterium]